MIFYQILLVFVLEKEKQFLEFNGYIDGGEKHISRNGKGHRGEVENSLDSSRLEGLVGHMLRRSPRNGYDDHFDLFSRTISEMASEE